MEKKSTQQNTRYGEPKTKSLECTTLLSRQVVIVWIPGTNCPKAVISMAYTKSCDECGAEFTARNKDHRFCTDDCRKNFWNNREVEITCAVCNTVFTAGFKVKACSEECSKIMNVVENQHARSDTLADDDIIYLIMLNLVLG